jgi:NADH dehydrogenase (ubiquinone) 1 alpha subcomplex subunit 6
MSFTTPTYLAVKTATSKSLDHSKRRVISLYRQWQRAVRIPLPIDETDPIRKQAPEIVETYALVIPVSAVRSRIRQEFERHRYVQELSVIDVLIFKGIAEYQVPPPHRFRVHGLIGGIGDDEFLEV